RLGARVELRRRARAPVVGRVRAEGLAFEAIAPRAADRRDRGTRYLVVFRLVVGGDDLVFADGELRKWIALGIARLAGETGANVALLAHAIDVQVHAILVLRAATDRGLALGIDLENHARHG